MAFMDQPVECIVHHTHINWLGLRAMDSQEVWLQQVKGCYKKYSSPNKGILLGANKGYLAQGGKHACMVCKEHAT